MVAIFSEIVHNILYFSVRMSVERRSDPPIFSNTDTGTSWTCRVFLDPFKGTSTTQWGRIIFTSTSASTEVSTGLTFTQSWGETRREARYQPEDATPELLCSVSGSLWEKGTFDTHPGQIVSVEEKMAIFVLILPYCKLLFPGPVVIYSKPTDMQGG